VSPGTVGAIVGFIVGMMGFTFIRLAASRVESKGVTADPAKTAGLLRMVAVADLILFTVIGYFVGPMIVSGPGN